MLVYSVASKQSFEMISIIRDKILNHLVCCPLRGYIGTTASDTHGQGADWVPLVIVGNKSDLKSEQRQVLTEQGAKLAEDFHCSFTEASARLNTNVLKAFELLIGEIEKSTNPSEPTGGSNKCCVM